MFKIAKLSAVVATVAALSVPAFSQTTQPGQPGAANQPNTTNNWQQNQPGATQPSATQPGMAPQANQPGATAASGNIIEAARRSGQLNTFTRALEAADISELTGAGPVTVFAPSDQAFQQLSEGKVEELLQPQNKQKLQELIKAHIVSGRVTAAEISSMDSAKTLTGKDLQVQATGGSVRIGEATVTQPDLTASNGVIHVIDKVLKSDKAGQ